MSRFDELFAERFFNFVLALIVATVIAVAAGYVLRSALLGPHAGSTHRTAATTWRAHS